MDPWSIFHNPHELVVAWVLFTIVSSAVSALPAPSVNANPFYVWLYKTLNGVMGSLKQVSMRQVETPEIVRPPAEVTQPQNGNKL